VLANRYTVGELLGEGGWGAVYAGVQNDLGRKVALKILHTDVALATEAVARFQREAKAAASFGHPNIVQVTDFQSNPNEPPFLVMEMLTGSTLGGVLSRQVCLPPARVASITFQVLSALDVAHRAGIVHRDVKPDNVFLVSMPGIEDFVKLLDFGIAKLSAENLAQITDQGQLLGSPAFMSPEQIRSMTIDHRADLYSVGATMYYALAGRLPFDATSIPALLAAIMDQKPKPLSEVAPGVDPRLAAIVERSLHKDPNGRFASAADMRVALEPWVKSASHPGMGVTLESAPTNGPTPPTRPIHVHDAGPTYPAAGVQPGMITTGAPMVMSSSPAQPMLSPAGASPPLGSPPPGAMTPAGFTPNTHPSYGAQASNPYGPQAMAPTPAPAPQKSAAMLVVMIATLVLVVLGLFGGAGAFFYFRSASRDAALAQNGPTNAPTSTAATPTGTPTGTAIPGPTTTNGAQRGPNPPGPKPIPPNPGPTPTNVVTVDAGGGRLATVDAGPSPSPTPPAKKQMAGSSVKISGGSYEKYEIEKGRAAVERVMPQLNGCYAATEFDPPDHQFTCWSFVIDGAGNVTSVKRSTEFDPHPKLDTCVIAALRSSKWPALAGGGSPQVCLAARTKDNP